MHPSTNPVSSEKQNKTQAGDPVNPEEGIFADPSIQRTFTEDPLFRFLKNNGSNLLFTIFLLGLAIWGYYRFQANTKLRGSAAADRFHRVVDLYEQLEQNKAALAKLGVLATDEGKTAEEKVQNEKKRQADIEEKNKLITTNKNSLVEVIRALGDDQSPYPLMADLYRGLLARDEGQVEEMRNLLNKPWQDYAVGQPERIIFELSQLAYARAIITDEKQKATAKAQLVKLAQEGVVAYLAASVSLANFAVTPEEAKQAKDLLEQAQARAAKNKDLVTQEMKQVEALISK